MVVQQQLALLVEQPFLMPAAAGHGVMEVMVLQVPMPVLVEEVGYQILVEVVAPFVKHPVVLEVLAL
jgi:hypothetical protein